MSTSVNIPTPYLRQDQRNIYDVRTFQPHVVKEVEEWSYKKLKNEKWFVYLDCETKKFNKWKLTDN